MPEKKILIVDDDPDIVRLVKSALERGGRTFITALDGVDAVEKVFTEMPDLVILDIMMPKMNGYQVCRLLKNEKTTWRIPVLMLTARAKDKDRFYGMSVGADGYIIKPFHATELKDKVDELLDKPALEGKACPIEAPVRASETNLLSRVNSLLDRKLQEMTFLQHITRSMVSTFDEDRILETVMEGIRSELGYKRVAIFMQEEGAMTGKVVSGFPEKKDASGFAITDAEVLSTFPHNREPVTLTGKRMDIWRSPYQGAQAAEYSQQCLVPIAFREEVNGVILLERHEGEPPFSQERLGVLSTLAVQLGLALDNARLYRTTLHLSVTDGLTGLYNARYFYEKLEREISRARRYGHPLSLFMLDIDHFKQYNDAYGHLMGDEALKQLARILKEGSRETDTVARYGGEEFCVVLPETGAENAVALAERIRKAVEDSPVDPGGGRPKVTLTISIGIATLPAGMQSSEDFVRIADNALYRAKQAGRNRVCIYG